MPVSYFFEDIPRDDVDDIAETRQPLDFLTRPEGLELATHFLKIEDAATRRKLIELVRSLAQAQVAGARL